MTYQEFIKKCPNKEIYLYISGSQGVSSAILKVIYGKDFNSISELTDIFLEFIDENALENIEDYLEDCDYDEDEALNEAIADSGEFYLGLSENNFEYQFDGMYIFKI